MEKTSICLWFNDNGEEAARSYVDIFPDSKIIKVSNFGDAGTGPGEPNEGKKGQVMAVDFEMMGRRYMALNGGEYYKLTPAASVMVYCKDQAEIDNYWKRLLDGGGKEIQCGWLEDRFGLSWQVLPEKFDEWLSKDDETTDRVMNEVFQMVKLDIAKIEAAYNAG